MPSIEEFPSGLPPVRVHRKVLDRLTACKGKNFSGCLYGLSGTWLAQADNEDNEDEKPPLAHLVWSATGKEREDKEALQGQKERKGNYYYLRKKPQSCSNLTTSCRVSSFRLGGAEWDPPLRHRPPGSLPGQQWRGGGRRRRHQPAHRTAAGMCQFNWSYIWFSHKMFVCRRILSWRCPIRSCWASTSVATSSVSSRPRGGCRTWDSPWPRRESSRRSAKSVIKFFIFFLNVNSTPFLFPLDNSRQGQVEPGVSADWERLTGGIQAPHRKGHCLNIDFYYY